MRLFSILLLFIVLVSVSKAQVNTELMRKVNVVNGFAGAAKFGLNFRDGNSKNLDLIGGLDFDYNDSDIYLFMRSVLKYTHTENIVYNQKAFVHLRCIWHLNEWFNPEAYTQRNYDKSQRLSDRYLFGGGVRLKMIEKLNEDSLAILSADIGSGAMYEHEKLNLNPIVKTDLIRTSSYIFIMLKFDEKVWLKSTTYHQASVKNFDDFRIYSETDLGFKLTKNLIFKMTARYRYDSQPPQDLKPYDIEFSNEISILF